MPDLTFTEGDDYYQTLDPGTYRLTFLGGNDTLYIDSSATVTADMGPGNDEVFDYDYPNADPSRWPGPVAVSGGSGDDHFFIGWNNFTGDGGDGNDLIDIDYGDDISVGAGTGNDVVNIFGPVSNLVVDSGDGDDVLHGRYVGGYVGAFSNASLSGGAGNDRFYDFQASSSDSLQLLGGSGNDVYKLNPATAPAVVELAGEGIDTIRIPVGTSYTLPENVENLRAVDIPGNTADAASLTGNALNNVIVAGSTNDYVAGLHGNDWLYGGGGNDFLTGGAGKDHLDGGLGSDQLLGGSGNDVLAGGDGDDILVGGSGADSISGGAGRDVFSYESVDDASVYAFDTLVDFHSGEDVIDLSAIDANPDLAGNQAFTLVYPDDTYSGSGALYVAQVAAGGAELYSDLDGDHNFELRIWVPDGFGSNDITL